MIAHVVLFRPSPNLSSDEREQFVTALERALSSIPEIRRARVGRRKTLGRAYDTLAGSYPFAAILEFDSEADLRAYLDHPSHVELGQRFFVSAEAVLVHDFEMVDGASVRTLI